MMEAGAAGRVVLANQVQLRRTEERSRAISRVMRIRNCLWASIGAALGVALGLLSSPMDTAGSSAHTVYLALFVLLGATCGWALANNSRRRRQLDLEEELNRREFNAMRENWPEGVANVEGADVHEVGRLPTHIVSAEDISIAPAELKDCIICMEEFAEGQEQKTLPCFHRFHTACVDKWLVERGCCPICKHRVDGRTGSDVLPLT